MAAARQISGDSSKEVTITEVASVLQSGFFLVTGSASAEGSPLVFSLDSITPEPDEDKQRNALVYIASLPTFSTDKNLDYCFIIDRRKSSWTCVRKLFTLLANSFNRPIKEVVLLQPAGFFQRRFSTSEATKLQQEFPRLQASVLDDTDALVKKFGSDLLCTQLGGSLCPNTDSFIQQRMSIDSLECNCVDLEERVKELILDDAQNDFDIPNDVASTEALLNEHAETKNNLSDEILNIKNQGEIVLQCFRDEVKNLPPTQQMLHIQEVQKLTARLEDLEEAIRDYWEKEETKLQECMRLREFHEEFKSLQQNLNKLSDALVSVKDYVSSVEEATNNAKRLSKIDIESQSLLARANQVAKEWGGKLNSTDQFTMNTVTPKCEELVRLHDLCTESLRYKQMLAEKQSTLYVHIDEARQWLADEDQDLLEPLSEQQSEDVSLLNNQLKQIDCQLAIGKFLELLQFESFMLTYSPTLKEESTIRVKEVYEKVMELMARYELRRSTLYEEIARLSLPIRHAKSVKGKSKSKLSTKKNNTEEGKLSPDAFDKAEALINDSTGFRSNRLRHSSKRSLNGTSDSTSTYSEISNASTPVGRDGKGTPRFQRSEISYSPASQLPPSPTASSLSGRDRQSHKGDDFRSYTDEHSQSSEMASESSDQLSEMTRTIAETGMMESLQKEKSGGISKRRGSIKVIKDIFTRRGSSMKKTGNMLPALADNTSLSSLTVNTGVFERSLTIEEEKSMAKVRSDLVKDLINSEEKYITDLNHIMEFYMRPIEEGGDLVPVELYASRSLIFSNLQEIIEFNSKNFIHELRENMNSPSLMGSAFKTRCNDLMKYKDFCTSRSRAEVLLRQLADESFLTDRYRLQGHPTTLCAQLLLPARRMVYYHNFLKAMHKNLKDDEEAQRDITLVMTQLNSTVQIADNLIHQVTIDGYDNFISFLEQVDYSTHGSLLHHSPVQVAHDKKSQHTRVFDFKSKLKHRHLFLYERVLLFCRIHDDKDKLRPYSFMHALKLEEAVLQSQNESPNKFVFHCNNESYLIECSSADYKTWKENIKFAIDNCNNEKQQEFSPLAESSFTSPTAQSHISSKPKNSMHMDDDDIILEQDPDIDMFNLDDDIDLLDQLSPNEINHNTSGRQQYMLREDVDNDLMLDRGDVIECVEIRKDMMKVQIPGTGITSWMALDVLVPYD